MIILPFAAGAYSCIEADPGWAYRDRNMNGFASVRRYRIHTEYPVMHLSEILGMGDEIKRLSAPKGCHLWLWTTKDFLEDGFQVLRQWGFSFKQIFTWVKTNKDGSPSFGMGYWGRNACEYILFGSTSASFGMLPARTTAPNWIYTPEDVDDYRDGDVLMCPRSRHSRKPDLAYQMIRELSPGPRLSVFQREDREGFDCWGNEMVPDLSSLAL